MFRVAMLFPGQGSQVVGMGKDLADHHAAARAVYELADQVLGFSVRDVCWDGPADRLTQTMYAQPAIVVTSLACLAALAAEGVHPDVVAGHSVGEISALFAAGVLTQEEAIRLSQVRGELMESAGQKSPGTMAAVLNLGHMELEAVCQEASSIGLGTVVVANFNTADQIVMSGHVPAVEKASELATARGARRVLRLHVGGAFHSPLMADAAPAMAQALDAATFRDARVPFLSSTTVEELSDAGRLREVMKRQITSQVRWEPSMRMLLSGGATVLPIEVGAGTALSGMIKKISKGTECLRVGDNATLQSTVAAVLQRAASNV